MVGIVHEPGRGDQGEYGGAHDNVIEEVRYHTVETKSTKTTIPFLKNNNFDYANLVNWAGDYKEEAAWLVFVLMVIFVVTAVSNGANMTDGLDGLAAGTSAIIGVALGILAYMSSHFEFASFLNIMFIPGAEELVVYAAALSVPRSVSYGTTRIRPKYLWEIRVA